MIIYQDGEITDMQRTIDRIVAASSLPLSIVIVGVGGANFTKMVLYWYNYWYNYFVTFLFNEGNIGC